MVHSTKTKLETKKILDIGKYRLRARAGWYCVLIGESNVAIDPAIGGYGVADIYLREFLPHLVSWYRRDAGPCAIVETRELWSSDLSLALVYSAAKFARQVSPNSVSRSRVRPLSSRRGAAMLPVKPAIFPRRVRTSRERTARGDFFRTGRQASMLQGTLPYTKYSPLGCSESSSFLFVYHRGGQKSR